MFSGPSAWSTLNNSHRQTARIVEIGAATSRITAAVGDIASGLRAHNSAQAHVLEVWNVRDKFGGPTRAEDDRASAMRVVADASPPPTPHLPRVESPLAPLVQLERTLHCQCRSDGFESHTGRNMGAWLRGRASL